MPFPDRPSSGNYIPDSAFKPGRAFPAGPLAETTSRNERLEWDALSQRGRMRKLCSEIDVQNGMPFPVEAWGGNRVPEFGQFGGQVVERAPRQGCRA